MEIEKSDYIKGSIIADKEGVMLTSVPYLEGFNVYVDDREVEKYVVGDAMLGVPLDKGKHVIEFKYNIPINVKGIVISVIALIVFIIICIITGNSNLSNQSDIKEKD